MRPLFAIATVAFLLGACTQASQTSTATPPATTTPKPGSAITASGKTRIALMLPLSGRSAPIGQAMQQAAELSLFDTGKELALASYDSGDSPDQAAKAYRKARTEGVTPADVEWALYEERSLVRLLAMRRTLWAVPRELLPAVFAGATKAVAATTIFVPLPACCAT